MTTRPDAVPSRPFRARRASSARRAPRARSCRAAALRSALLLLALGSPALASGETEIVFDLAGFQPLGVGGEVFGVGSEEGTVIGARMDVTFVSNETGPWSMAASFVDFPMGGAIGFSSEVEGWSGAGTFSTTIESDALNGELAVPPGAPFYSWFLSWVGGAPFTPPGGGVAIGPMDGHFEVLRLTLTICGTCPPWSDLGGGSPGVVGTPRLVGEGPLLAGSGTSLCLSDAPAGGLVLALGAFASTPVPALGGTLHANPATVQRLFFTDGAGELVLTVPWPASIPPGTDLWFQFVAQDATVPAGLTLSNAVTATTP